MTIRFLLPRLLLPVLLCCLPGVRALAAETVKETPLVAKARTALEALRTTEALKLATEAIAADPADPNAFYIRARVYEVKRQFEDAIKDYSVVLQTDPKATGVYLRRANLYNQTARFDESLKDYNTFIERSVDKVPWEVYKYRADVELRTGKIAPAILDYNKAVALNPQFEAHNWERGIAYYYAGRYEEGAKQFKLHTSVNPDDVENAVWHYLCVARKDGVEKARAGLINIKHDGRVPMMQIYALYAGKATPESVLKECEVPTHSPDEIRGHLFYAHVYLGLYYEAQGNAKMAREHILKATDTYGMTHYMGDIARVHAARMRAADAGAK